jgi:lipopolysaccharide/colanic/teichoic acid biosynthesis glycosyltransferase
MASSTGFNVHPLYDRRRYQYSTFNPSIYYASKRVIDIVFSLLFLLAISPILVVVALLIKLDSPGPIFFKQTRVGSRMYRIGSIILWKHENFYCYKFRTMRHNSNQSIHQAYMKALITDDKKTMKAMEGEKASLHKLVNDNRVTRVGKYLRKLSLDEIPQFINVIKGEMSIVGPRPAIPYEVDIYTPWFLRRFEAKPGITGLQQITARCTECFDQQVRLDIQYIQNQSFWYDMKIMLKTPLALITQKGV